MVTKGFCVRTDKGLAPTRISGGGGDGGGGSGSASFGQNFNTGSISLGIFPYLPILQLIRFRPVSPGF
jgi:hypothetical protein